MKALVIAIHDDKRLDPATLPAITAARQLAPGVDLLVAGHDCTGVAQEAATVEGIGRVLLCDAEACTGHLPENLAPLVQRLAPDYSHLLVPATTGGKNLMPRVAALLDTAQVSDIVGVDSPATFRRPIYAGNVIATVQGGDPVTVITVRPTAFEPAVAGGSEPVPIVEVEGVEDAGLSRVVETCLAVSERPELASAEIVVSGGRGLGSKENFRLVYDLADRLGAAVGATRAAVDAGFIGNEAQVGQTGKVVAPRLYIALGISGAIQHLAGMKESQVIVAINKDPEAPIFQVADYGIVGDLFEVVPQLIELLPPR